LGSARDVRKRGSCAFGVGGCQRCLLCVQATMRHTTCLLPRWIRLDWAPRISWSSSSSPVADNIRCSMVASFAFKVESTGLGSANLMGHQFFSHR
jgi:hypothetical protein